MSRLSEREIQEILRARRAVRDEAADLQTITLQAKQLRIAVLASLIAGSLRAARRLVARALAPVQPLVQPLRDGLRRRRSAAHLWAMDDRMLADIGLDRGMIESYVTGLDAASHPRTLPALGAGLRRWLEARATIRRLQALDDRMLRDIGLVHGDIEHVVRRSLAAAAAERERPAALARLIREAEQSHGAGAAPRLGRDAVRRISALGSAALAESGYVTQPGAHPRQSAA